MLEWYALREDFNKRKIENYNVLSGWEEKIKKAAKPHTGFPKGSHPFGRWG